MSVPVVHGCSVLATPEEPDKLPEGGYIRHAQQLDYGARCIYILYMSINIHLSVYPNNTHCPRSRISCPRADTYGTPSN